jgi:endonuclease I
VVNLEHTWPQSKFNCDSFEISDPAEDQKMDKREILHQKTDMQHLYAAHTKLNADRGNFEFAEVGKGNKRSYPTCTTEPEDNLLGLAKTPPGMNDDGKTYFEPPRAHRGNVARSIFYFSVRYNKAINPVEEYYLRKWHQEDPVNEAERSRHEMIYQAQGTRNPFIDMPELVERIQDF